MIAFEPITYPKLTRWIKSFVILSGIFFAQTSSAQTQDFAALSGVKLSRYHVLPGEILTLNAQIASKSAVSGAILKVSLFKNGANALVKSWSRKANLRPEAPLDLAMPLDLPPHLVAGDYRLKLEVKDAADKQILWFVDSVSGFISAAADKPLPYRIMNSISAHDLIDRMGVVTSIRYQTAPEKADNPYDLPNRDGEKELINALKYLGLHHIRNGTLQADPMENSLRAGAAAAAPDDFTNFKTVLTAIPDLKLDFLIDAGGPTHWGDGGIHDPQIVLHKLADLGALASIEAPNEPNFQATFSPSGQNYSVAGQDFSQNLYRYNEIWSDWGHALKTLKSSSPAFRNVLLLPPSSGVWGPNGPDGVENLYARAGLHDHSALYDVMNFHSYGPQGSNMGDPLGEIAQGNPPNWGAYQVSVSNWGRYAMPGRDSIITESGANMQREQKTGLSLSEKAQGLAILNNYFWSSYYGARRLYAYQLVDDSTDLTSPTAARWGLFRGDWTPKLAADYVHRYVAALNDPEDAGSMPDLHYSVAGKSSSSWGATLTARKSDGSYLIICNNELPVWDRAKGVDLTPESEKWTITLGSMMDYEIIDVVRGTTSTRATGAKISVEIAGYPMLVHVFAKK